MLNMQRIKPKYLTYIVFVVVILAWSLTHLIWVSYISKLPLFVDNSLAEFVFWTVMKIIVWILPALYLLKVNDISIRNIYRFKFTKSSVLWVAVPSTVVLLYGLFVHESQSSLGVFATLNVLIVAPIFEEFFLRGAILQSFLKTRSTLSAIVQSTLFFAVLHIPGLIATGSLGVGILIQVAITGVICGLIVVKSKSVLGSTIYHFMNNFSNTSL